MLIRKMTDGGPDGTVAGPHGLLSISAQAPPDTKLYDGAGR